MNKHQKAQMSFSKPMGVMASLGRGHREQGGGVGQLERGRRRGKFRNAGDRLKVVVFVSPTNLIFIN